MSATQHATSTGSTIVMVWNGGAGTIHTIDPTTREAFTFEAAYAFADTLADGMVVQSINGGPIQRPGTGLRTRFARLADRIARVVTLAVVIGVASYRPR